ncbi:DUF3048 domain-containing protein [Patescibacteria group bacterium]|nr:DUF3048 domain-containing protein [Patescibacteria group bacterium]
MLWSVKKSKKTPVIIVVIVLIIIAIVAGSYLFKSEETVTGNTNSERNSNNISEEMRAIDGTWVEIGRENMNPVAIMIENLVASRPQSGVNKANLVYEVLVEGGITRFMAVYASGDEVEKIGPVRSARDYYLDWAKELNAVYAHVGGSPKSFELIPQYDIIDLNQFYNSQYFWRSSDRYAPHNLYTSSELLARAIRDKDFSETGDYESWEYSKTANPADSEKTLTIGFSTYNYLVEYKYNKTNNEFIRYQAGEPHTMENGEAISAKNVVVQYVKTRTADDENRLSIETIGEGDARIYIDGKEINGQWKKPARDERTKYYDSSGDEIEFNRGTTWVEVLPTDRTVTFE